MVGVEEGFGLGGGVRYITHRIEGIGRTRCYYSMVVECILSNRNEVILFLHLL